MQPSKVTIAGLFDSREQYLIPLFQRGYVWTLGKQIQRLWEDVIDRFDAMLEHAKNAKVVGGAGKLKAVRKHFLGAVIVSAAESFDVEVVPKREVIDGQQRLTTLQLMLIAMRDVLKGLYEALDDDLKTLTTNRGQYKSKDDFLKVMPTNVGRDVMRALYEAGSAEAVAATFPIKSPERITYERPLMVQAYLLFSALIEAHVRGKRFDDPVREDDESDEPQTIIRAVIRSIAKDNSVVVPFKDRPIDLSRAHDLLLAMRTYFQIMRLQLDEEDDPQIIFETLNALGEPLTPSDLIRNYLFLRFAQVDCGGQSMDDLYNEYWRAFDEKPDHTKSKKGAKFWKEMERQGRLSSPRLDLFFFHYTAFRRRENSKVAHVFEDFKEWWEQDGDRDFSKEFGAICKHAREFEIVISPGQETRFDLFCRRMKLLDTSTHTPLIFYLLDNSDLADEEFAKAMVDLESYIVRRFVCGLTTNAYNRVFIDRLLAEMPPGHKPDANLIRGKLVSLTGPSQRWPDDEEFKLGWVHRRLYQGSNTNRVQAILEGLERALHSFRTDIFYNLNDLSVEHVLPQKWQANYPLGTDGPELREKRERLLHSIGNLTLVTPAFNSSLSNERFAIKRPEIAANSGLRLNAYFQGLKNEDQWSEDAIIKRAEALFSVACKVWPHPSGGGAQH